MKPSQITMLLMIAIIAVPFLVVVIYSRVNLSSEDEKILQPWQSVSESYDIGGFSGVELVGNWEASLTQGDQWDIQLEYVESFEDEISIYLEDELLVVEQIAAERRIGRNTAIFGLNIVMPELNQLNISGEGQTSISGFVGSELELYVAGIAGLEGSEGSYRELDLLMAGNAEVDLSDLPVTNAQINLAGPVHAILAMDGGELSGVITGTGELQYLGSVLAENIGVAATGSVRRIE